MTVLDGHRITITAPLFMLQQNENLLCSHADQTWYGGGTIRCGAQSSMSSPLQGVDRMVEWHQEENQEEALLVEPV